jgi:hypothetical protein
MSEFIRDKLRFRVKIMLYLSQAATASKVHFITRERTPFLTA